MNPDTTMTQVLPVVRRRKRWHRRRWVRWAAAGLLAVWVLGLISEHTHPAPAPAPAAISAAAHPVKTQTVKPSS